MYGYVEYCFSALALVHDVINRKFQLKIVGTKSICEITMKVKRLQVVATQNYQQNLYRDLLKYIFLAL